MGSQIGIQYDVVDEGQLVRIIEAREPWLALDVQARAWVSLDSRPPGSLWLGPSRIVSKIDPARFAHQDKLLQWSRVEQVTPAIVRVGRDRLWCDTISCDPEIKRVYSALARFVTGHSTHRFEGDGRPIYVGAHLAEEVLRGTLVARWMSGTSVEIVPNPRALAAKSALLFTGTHVRQFKKTRVSVNALTFELQRVKLPRVLKELCSRAWTRKVRSERVTIEFQLSPNGSTLAERPVLDQCQEFSPYLQVNDEVATRTASGRRETLWRTIYAGPVVQSRAALPQRPSFMRLIIPVVRPSLMPRAGEQLSLDAFAVIIDAAMEVCGEPG